MTQPLFTYGTNSLSITIPTNCPEHLHRQLLTGINAVLKQCIIHPVENNDDISAISSLFDLQKSLLPLEEELERINS